MGRFLASLFSPHARRPPALRGLQITAETRANGGSWRGVRNAYVEIEGKILIKNTSQRTFEVFHVDVGRPESWGDPPDVRALSTSIDIAPHTTVELSFRACASPIFPVAGEWLSADVILWDDAGQPNRLPAVRFRQADPS